jgi:DNA repair ATPase RecN
MSDAIRPPGPQYIATKQIPKVEVPQNTLDAILSEVRAGREESNQRFDKLETTVDTLLEDGKSANKRMTQIEVRMDMFEDRGTKHSSGVRHLSETDAKHDAAIAMLHTKVDRLTSIAERLDKVAANPMVRRVAYAVGSAILAYLATKGWLVK